MTPQGTTRYIYVDASDLLTRPIECHVRLSVCANGIPTKKLPLNPCLCLKTRHTQKRVLALARLSVRLDRPTYPTVRGPTERPRASTSQLCRRKVKQGLGRSAMPKASPFAWATLHRGTWPLERIPAGRNPPVPAQPPLTGKSIKALSLSTDERQVTLQMNGNSKMTQSTDESIETFGIYRATWD